MGKGVFIFSFVPGLVVYFKDARPSLILTDKFSWRLGVYIELWEEDFESRAALLKEGIMLSV
jgi:hypothetical protein